ncbi:DUF1648 domain-containing protein [Coraliomargarita akajimensis]|uniref:DUF1648 domain-containing protein n=1 Tax=Coraliomargarita akajimensis (strain DSM 45221 / IAM 15411 / JCM 23193 / KCTC 12865 / 04OKA010-24) TaxID=583355 RepID=D5ENN0_CORAD|nr:DUF1648 domain-containing protein [Coraliomargarita akajimensis]ADE55506.1 protein of unknown function DUF1648 [Coraliomargarita akajimensis DSM 45221]
MRVLFIVGLVANLLLAASTWLFVPETVAVHFDSAGSPNAWVSPRLNAGLMAGVNLLLFVALCLGLAVTKRSPARWLNVPNRNFWLQLQNRDQMNRMISGLLYQYGFATYLFLFVIQLLVFKANRAEVPQLNLLFFWGATCAFLAYTGFWCYLLLRRFALPETSAHVSE